MNIEETFLTFEEAKSAIEKLKSCSWPEFKEDDDVDEYVKSIFEIITSEFKKYPNFLLPLKPKDFNFGIFRVREVSTNVNLNLFKEHSYPPPSVTKLGRCNFPKFPVFYGSTNPITALAETTRTENTLGRKFCISSWEIIKTNQTFVFESFLQTSLHPKNMFDLLAKMLVEKIDEPLKELPQSQKLGMLEFLKFTDDQFINDKNYNISASFAHRRIYGKHNMCTDILMYPSIQTGKQGVNLAINPNFVENHMRIKRFYIVEPQSYNHEKGSYNITIHKYGEIKKNVIFWKNLDPKDKLYQKYIKLDFKDSFGQKKKLTFTHKEP